MKKNLNYSNQQLYCELLNTFGLPSIYELVNIYIRQSLSWILPINPKYNPMYLMKTETHSPFLFLLPHFIPVHSMKITEVIVFNMQS